ncbi:MAG: lactate utilization protein [Acidobacteriota bacterium]
MLCREFEAAGGTSHRVDSIEQARQQVVDLLVARSARHVLRGDTLALQQLGLDDALAAADVAVTVARMVGEDDREPIRTVAFSADAGITSVDYAVAESGTLALLTAPGQGRSVSLLPPVHLAILDARDIVLELSALLERVEDCGAMPSALTFITGPSKTGDIEQKLTVGVHGPGEIHLVLVAALE